MRALVHAGIVKTGTTFLQGVLFASQHDLAAAGIIYPAGYFLYQQHLGLAAAFMRYRPANIFRVFNINSEKEKETFRAKIIEWLCTLANRRTPRVLFSSEHLSLFDDEEIKEFLTVMCEIFNSVDVCIFVRRQDDLALSAFSEYVRNGGAAAFELPSPPRFDFAALLSQWERYAEPGRLTVFNFKPDTFRKSFFRWVGIPALAEKESDQLHASLDCDEIVLLREFNHLFPRYSSDKAERVRGELISLIDLREKRAAMTLSDSDRAAIASAYAKVNSIVSERYLGGETIIP